MTNEAFAEYFKARTKKWAVQCLKYISELPDHTVLRVIRNQFTKSATSVAANYRAACRGRSKAEFLSKISISIEEADESLFWMELIEETGFDNSQQLEALKAECTEILKVLVKARINSK